MDTTMESFLKGKGTQGTKALAQDKSLARITNKIRDILGPLTKIWQRVERARSPDTKDDNTLSLDLDDVALNFQHSMMLIGQAINATNFYRRKITLSTLGNRDNEVNNMLREVHVEDLKKGKNYLFGDEFLKTVGKQAKNAGKTMKQFLMPQESIYGNARHSKPFSSSSSSIRSRSDEHSRKNGNYTQRGKIQLSQKHSTLFQSGKNSADNGHIKGGRILLLQVTRRDEKSIFNPSQQKQISASGRSNKILLSKLGENNPGPINSRNSAKGVEYSPRKNPTSKENSKTNYIQIHSEIADGDRNSSLTGEGCYHKSNSNKTSISINHISKREEGARDLSTCNKSERIELSHTLRKVQDGDTKRCERDIKTGRLHDKNRSKRCIFFNSSPSELQKVCEVSVGGDPVRVPDTNVWGRSSTQVFHKNFENTDFAIEKIESEISDLHRRHFDNGNLDNRDRDSQKYNNSPLTKFGVHNKLQEISVRANPNIRISGSSDRQSKNDFLNTHRENSEIRNPLSQYPAKRENNNKGISQLDREFNGNSPSLNSCPTTGEVSSKMSEQTFEEIPTKLRIHNSIGSPGKGGTELDS